MGFHIEDAQLAAMNLRRTGTRGEYEIVLPEFTNMAAATVGRFPALLMVNLVHFPAVVATELRRQQANQQTDEAPGGAIALHRRPPLPALPGAAPSQQARAWATVSSRRAISALSTLPPKRVMPK